MDINTSISNYIKNNPSVDPQKISNSLSSLLNASIDDYKRNSQTNIDVFEGKDEIGRDEFYSVISELTNENIEDIKDDADILFDILDQGGGNSDGNLTRSELRQFIKADDSIHIDDFFYTLAGVNMKEYLPNQTQVPTSKPNIKPTSDKKEKTLISEYMDKNPDADAQKISDSIGALVNATIDDYANSKNTNVQLFEDTDEIDRNIFYDTISQLTSEDIETIKDDADVLFDILDKGKGNGDGKLTKNEMQDLLKGDDSVHLVDLFHTLTGINMNPYLTDTSTVKTPKKPTVVNKEVLPIKNYLSKHPNMDSQKVVDAINSLIGATMDDFSQSAYINVQLFNDTEEIDRNKFYDAVSQLTNENIETIKDSADILFDILDQGGGNSNGKLSRSELEVFLQGDNAISIDKFFYTLASVDLKPHMKKTESQNLPSKPVEKPKEETAATRYMDKNPDADAQKISNALGSLIDASMDDYAYSSDVNVSLFDDNDEIDRNIFYEAVSELTDETIDKIKDDADVLFDLLDKGNGNSDGKLTRNEMEEFLNGDNSIHISDFFFGLSKMNIPLLAKVPVQNIKPEENTVEENLAFAQLETLGANLVDAKDSTEREEIIKLMDEILDSSGTSNWNKMYCYVSQYEYTLESQRKEMQVLYDALSSANLKSETDEIQANISAKERPFYKEIQNIKDKLFSLTNLPYAQVMQLKELYDNLSASSTPEELDSILSQINDMQSKYIQDPFEKELSLRLTYIGVVASFANQLVYVISKAKESGTSDWVLNSQFEALLQHRDAALNVISTQFASNN